MKTRHLAPALLAILVTSGASAQTAPPPAQPVSPTSPLGRLFMTPESRAHLERQRQLNIKESRSLEGGTVRLDGVVVRSSGKSTVWVNNRPQTENARDTGVGVATSQKQPGSARLATGTEPPADLKVGVTLNRATRETEGGLADGAIRVNKPATGK